MSQVVRKEDHVVSREEGALFHVTLTMRRDDKRWKVIRDGRMVGRRKDGVDG